MQDPLHDYNHTSFIGCSTLQYHVDYLVWEKVFQRYAARLNQVIELGTGTSGFSLFLLLHCIHRNIDFKTFDINESIVLNRKVAQAVDLASHFYQVDLLNNPEKVHIHFKHPLLLFFDNGNKIKEVELYSPYLEAGDIAVVHDWKSEIFMKHIPDNWSMVFGSLCREVGGRTRFFEVI